LIHVLSCSMAKQEIGSEGNWHIAAREVAAEIRYSADKKSTRRSRQDLRGVANKLMAWWNLVFVGLVIAQAFSGKFDARLATVGIVLFLVAYLVATLLYVKRGGDKQ